MDIKQTKLKVEVEFGSYWTYDEDGDPCPTDGGSFEGQLIDALARMMLVRLEKNYGETLIQKVNDRVLSLVNEKLEVEVQRHIGDALDVPFRKTDKWGSPQGDPPTLRAYLVERIDGWWTEKVEDREGFCVTNGSNRNYSHARYKHVVEKALKAQAASMQEAVNKAVAEATRRIRIDAQRLLAAGINKVLGGEILDTDIKTLEA